MGHKRPVLRPRCIGTGRARTQILFNSIRLSTKNCNNFCCVPSTVRVVKPQKFLCDLDGENVYVQYLIRIICTPHQILFGDQCMKIEVSSAYCKYGEEKRCIQYFGRET